jgi:hypothetical protein
VQVKIGALTKQELLSIAWHNNNFFAIIINIDANTITNELHLIVVCSAYHESINEIVSDTYSSASTGYINFFSSLPESCATYPGITGTCITVIPALIES